MKIPRNNPEAETAVLGSVLMNNRALRLVKDHLVPGSFYTLAARLVFESMIEIDGPIDHLILSDHLKKRGVLDKTGGLIWLSGLTDNVATLENLREYIDILSDARKVREAQAGLVTAMNEIDDNTPADEIRRSILSIVKTATTTEDSSKGIVEASECAQEATESAVSTEPIVGVVKTRFRAFDELFGGLYPDTPYMIAGRPGMGKSCVSINILINALMMGARALVYTFEEGRKLLIWRMLSRLAQVPLWNIRNRNISEQDREELRNAGNMIRKFDFQIIDRPMSAKAIVEHSEYENEKKKVDLGIIDLLTKVIADGYGTDTSLTRASSKELSRLPGYTDCPWIVLHQLNRGVEGRARLSKSDDEFLNAILPQQSDLRDAGEEDFKGIIGVTRPHMYNEEKDPHEFVAKMMKNSNGPCGLLKLWCDMKVMTIKDEPRLIDGGGY